MKIMPNRTVKYHGTSSFGHTYIKISFVTVKDVNQKPKIKHSIP
jgi:hypothetical protein